MWSPTRVPFLIEDDVRRPKMNPFHLLKNYLGRASRPDSEEAINQGFAAKLTRIAGDNPVVQLAREAYRYVTHRRLPTQHKVMLIAALLYFLAPLDAVPDIIPGAGYVDDLLVLTAVLAGARKIIEIAREDAKEVVREAEAAAQRVVDHTLSETRETWGRRGVAQLALCLWASTTAATVGLIYYGARRLLGAEASVVADPFFWGVLMVAALGLGYNLFFFSRLWKKYSNLRPDVQEPLAWALVSLLDWRQVLILSLPILALLLIVLLRLAL